MSPKPQRESGSPASPAPREPSAGFPLSGLGPEWFGPSWLTDTGWFGHWDHLFPTRWPVAWPFGGGPAGRVEECDEDDAHVIRIELPGLDPETDITIVVEDDVLTVEATRQEGSLTEGDPAEGGTVRSQLSYGTFRRLVRLPPGSTADDVTAFYEGGVLEIRIHRPAPGERPPVPIRVQGPASRESKPS